MDSINTATTPTTPTPASFGIREQLEQLNAIKDLLTPEEYTTKRRDILASLNNNTATPVSVEEQIPLATVIVETVEDVDDDNNGVLDDASHGEIKYDNGNTYIGSLNTKVSKICLKFSWLLRPVSSSSRIFLIDEILFIVSCEV